MKWIPKFRYLLDAVLTTVTLSFPAKPWDYGSQSEGGFNKSSAGIPESYTVVRHETLILTIRYKEEERTDVMTMVRTLQNGSQAFDIWLDKDDNATQYSVYLEKPSNTELVKPQRSSYFGYWELEITVRSADPDINFDELSFYAGT